MYLMTVDQWHWPWAEVYVEQSCYWRMCMAREVLKGSFIRVFGWELQSQEFLFQFRHMARLRTH
jgi:hypothetical protein